MEESGFDLDELASHEFDISQLPAPPYTRSDLSKVLKRTELLAPGTEVRPLGGKDFAYQLPGMPAIRVTTDIRFFDENAESVELWTPGSPLFPYHNGFVDNDEIPQKDNFRRVIEGDFNV
ncbi:MAG: hypothetical protein U5P10_07950 [Spirochaetia bacterium]|nr:hypothetical protein [Spirochaetia bacterium]